MRAIDGAGVVLVADAALAGCGGERRRDSGPLTVYSGREEELVAPLFERFTRRRASTSRCATATAPSSRRRSPRRATTRRPTCSSPRTRARSGPSTRSSSSCRQRRSTASPQRFRDADGRWVGTSGRTRVLVYNTDALTESELPDSVLRADRPEWKGRVGIAPTNASFQAFVTAMRLSLGEERTREWLEGMKANDAKTYEKNTPIVEAVASGEIDARARQPLLPHLVKEEQPDAPIANHFFDGGRPRDARQRRGRGRAREHRPARRRRGVRRVPALRRGASGSTSTRPRRPSTRSSRASTRAAGLAPARRRSRGRTSS